MRIGDAGIPSRGYRRFQKREGLLMKIQLNFAEACVVADAFRYEHHTLVAFSWVAPQEFLTREVCRAMNNDWLDSRHGADRVALMTKLHDASEDDAGDLLRAVAQFWEGGGVDLLNPYERADVQRAFEYEGILPARGETPMEISLSEKDWVVKLACGTVLRYPLAMSRQAMLKAVAAR